MQLENRMAKVVLDKLNYLEEHGNVKTISNESQKRTDDSNIMHISRMILDKWSQV